MLAREIPGRGHFDVSGCYPLTPFSADADLRQGLDRLRRAGAVSVTVVPDPMHAPVEAELASAFDLFQSFKTHFVLDRSIATPRLGSTHRSNIRRARSCCDFRIIGLADHLPQWVAMYQRLVEAKGITGPARFPPTYFPALSQLPALTTFGAFQDGVLIAASLWLQSEDCVYYHLGASLPEGYKAQAMYGLVAMAIEHYRDVRMLHLGGAPGLADASTNGLAFFKRGFANTTRAAHLCGAILDRRCYAELVGHLPESAFFPRYRASAPLPQETLSVV